MAKFEVIHGGARQAGVALIVGDVVEIKGEVPASLVGKVRALSGESAPVLEVGTPAAKAGKAKAEAAAPPPPPPAQ